MDENQIVEELDYFLPDDYEEPEAEDTTEAEEAEEVTEEAEETVTEDVQDDSEPLEQDVEQVVTEEVETALKDIDIKFLHDNKKLGDYSQEEIKTTFQKGLNSDRLLEKVTIANERIEKIKELSELYKMNENELIDALYDQYFAATAEQEGKDKDFVKLNYESGKKQAKQKMYERFSSKYPDVKADAIPQEVWTAVQEGEDLSRAYDTHMKETSLLTQTSELTQLKTKIAELETKLKTKQNNETVKKKAVVGSTSKNGNDTVDGDDFLSGFLS